MVLVTGVSGFVGGKIMEVCKNVNADINCDGSAQPRRMRSAQLVSEKEYDGTYRCDNIEYSAHDGTEHKEAD